MKYHHEEGKVDYTIYANMSGICPDNQYADIYDTHSLIKALIMFIIFRIRYPQVIMTVGGRYLECSECPHDCDAKERNIKFEKGSI